MSSSSAGAEPLVAPRPGRASRRAEVSDEPAPRLWPWWLWPIVLAAVIAGAVAIVDATGMTPSFDAYGWLTWGHQLLYGNLNLNAAPSWKPLMIIFTLPMALFGSRAPQLLSIAMVSGTLAMAPFAGRIAYRLVVEGRGQALRTRRVTIAAWIGALFAAVGVLGLQGHGIPSGLVPPQSLWQLSFIADSDPFCAALVLAAIDAHLSRRPRLAYGVLFLACLNRPEAWPLIGLYGLYLMWRIPSMRLIVPISWGLVIVAWYLPTAVAAKSIFQASKLDQGKQSIITGEPVLPVLRRWVTFYEWPMQAAALLGVAIGLVRRDWRIIVLAAGSALWLAVEMVFAARGLSAVARYMIEPAAVMVAVAGYAIGRALAGPGERVTGRAARGLIGLAGAVVAVGLIATTAHFLHLRESRVRGMVPAVHNYGVVKRHLSQAVARAGGPRAVLACGPPAAKNQYQTQLAWTLGINGSQVMFNPPLLKRKHQRMVLFTQTPINGWTVRAYNMPPAIAARCARMMSLSVPSS